MFAILMLASAYAVAAPTPRQAEVIDRIVAVVNRTPILASDCDEELRFEAMVDGREVERTATARDAALERLVNQMLIEQQMTAARYVPAPEAETQAAIEQVKKQIAADDRQWAAALQKYGLNSGTVTSHVRRQLNQLRYIEMRFQSEARPTLDAVKKYYEGQYVPKVRAAGGSAKPLADVRDQIEQILAEQRVNELMTSWLQVLRSQAEINRREPAAGK